MKIPDFASQKELIESFYAFPQSETCDGYKNYIANLNIPYTSTNTPNASTQTSTTNVTYSWHEDSWGECNNDKQTRQVYCKSSEGNQVADSYCSGAKPATNQICPAITNSIDIKLVLVEKGSF